MSIHKRPLAELELRGLTLYHLPVGKPSQLSDSFRNGIEFALSETAYKLRLLEEVNKHYLEYVERSGIPNTVFGHPATVENGLTIPVRLLKKIEACLKHDTFPTSKE